MDVLRVEITVRDGRVTLVFVVAERLTIRHHRYRVRSLSIMMPPARARRNATATITTRAVVLGCVHATMAVAPSNAPTDKMAPSATVAPGEVLRTV